MPKQSIIIMTDTQRTDMLGCYGNSDMITVNLDELASEGAMYTNGYTCTPVCGPARSGLFTGIFPHSNGSWTNNQPLGANIKTIGQRLSDQGVKCGYIGKWHLDGSDYFGLGKCPEGWDPDYWYDMRNYLEELTDEERLLSRQMDSSNADWFTKEFTYGYRCSKRAMEFIEKYKDEDFLLVLSYDEPHHPSLCPPEYFNKYEDYIIQKNKINTKDTLEDKPAHHKVWAKVNKDLDGPNAILKVVNYAIGCNYFIDEEIGSVKKTIDKHVPDSMVFYTSDHGFHAMSHGLTNKGATMYEENVNIPFIIKWKDHIKANQTIDHPVSHINICPTVMDYFCGYVPKTMDGKSLLPHLKDQSIRTNEYIFSEFGRYEGEHDGFGGFQPIRCSMDGRYKLVVNLLTSDEFYDLQEDPEEMNNLINDESSAVVKEKYRLHDALLDWLNDTRDPFRGYYWHNRPWRKDAPEETWEYTAMTRQPEEDERYEPRQLDYSTGLVMDLPVRGKKG